MKAFPVCKGVWGREASKRKGPLEDIRLSGPGPPGFRPAAGEGVADGGAKRLAGVRRALRPAPPGAAGPLGPARPLKAA